MSELRTPHGTRLLGRILVGAAVGLVLVLMLATVAVLLLSCYNYIWCHA